MKVHHIAILFLCLFLIGCQSADEKLPKSSSPLAFRLNHFQLNLDPATIADVESRKIGTLIYCGLVAVDIDGAVHPRIAEKWAKRDVNTWAFTIKDNIYFSNGAKVTAESVARSLQWSMQPTHLYSWALNSITHTQSDSGEIISTGISTEGDQTVLIHESDPSPWFFEALDSPAGWIVADPTQETGAWGLRSGAGPFEATSIEVNALFTLKARTDGAVKALTDEIIFKAVADPQLACKMLEQNSLDMVRVESPDMLRILERGNAKLVKNNFQRYRIAIFCENSLKLKGYSKKQVLDFIHQYSRSLNRDHIVKISNGLAEAMYTAFPPAHGLKEMRAQNQKNEKLKTYIPKSDLTLLTLNEPYSDLIASNLPKSIGGASISYKSVESAVLINSLLNDKADIICMTIDATSSSPLFWTAFWEKNSPFVIFGTPLDELKNLDITSKEDILRAAEEIDRHGNWVGIVKVAGILAMTPRLKGLRISPTGQVSLEQVYYENE